MSWSVQFPPQSCPEYGFQERSCPLGSRSKEQPDFWHLWPLARMKLLTGQGHFQLLVTRKKKLDFAGFFWILGSPQKSHGQILYPDDITRMWLGSIQRKNMVTHSESFLSYLSHITVNKSYVNRI